MDKQTDIRTNPQNLIPVNTRTIGAPEGIYILYIEDYVHTFIKKILADNTQGEPLRDKYEKGDNQKNDQENYFIERIPQRNIALYGRSIEENGRYRIVISGAAVLDGGSEKIQQLNNTYFPSCSYIGSAVVSYNKDSRLRLELTLRSTKVILDDFYIYYDQNEEMQNYLVEWNTTRENDKSRVVLSPTEHKTDDTARLSRITQAYNREEAKVSFMWNVMNVLCLGFVVCVMAYGIISINNYNKMQNMQEKIDYCMAFVEENTSFLMNNTQTDATVQQNVQAENGIGKQDTMIDAAQAQTIPAAELEQTAQGQTTTQDSQQGFAQAEETSNAMQDSAQTESVPETTQALAQATIVSDDTQPAIDQTDQPVLDQAATPQYYVVRRGDTLRTICYNIYGDYSRVDEICRWNNIEDPNNILYGQKLLLPSK